MTGVASQQLLKKKRFHDFETHREGPIACSAPKSIDHNYTL